MNEDKSIVFVPIKMSFIFFLALLNYLEKGWTGMVSADIIALFLILGIQLINFSIKQMMEGKPTLGTGTTGRLKSFVVRSGYKTLEPDCLH